VAVEVLAATVFLLALAVLAEAATVQNDKQLFR
jgi:hypothetical protein